MSGTDRSFAVRPMSELDAQAIAGWHYSGEYAFYDADADADDLAELLDPSEWGRRYFAVGDALHGLVGFFVFKVSDDFTEIGLGLRPDLTGQGLGVSFLRTAMRYAVDTFGAAELVLNVAEFNERAITVYKRAGFSEVERYEHLTNGGLHRFVKLRAPADTAG